MLIKSFSLAIYACINYLIIDIFVRRADRDASARVIMLCVYWFVNSAYMMNKDEYKTTSANGGDWIINRRLSPRTVISLNVMNTY